jgi:hypothetical protein
MTIALLKATRILNRVKFRPRTEVKALSARAIVIQSGLLAYCHLPVHNMGPCDTWGYINNEKLLNGTSAPAYRLTLVKVVI